MKMISVTHTVPAGILVLPGAPNMRLAILKDDRHFNCFMDSSYNHLCTKIAFYLHSHTIFCISFLLERVSRRSLNIESFVA